MASVASGLLDFVIAFVLLIGLMLYYGIGFSGKGEFEKHIVFRITADGHFMRHIDK